MLRLCPDPLVSALRDTFRANVIRVPEARVVPLSVISDGRSTAFRGSLAPILTNATDLGTLELRTERMSDVSNSRTREVKAELGLRILDGFLRGFQVPSGAVTAALSKASSVSFSFRDVNRTWADVNRLGEVLDGASLRRTPATAIYFEDRADLLVIDSIITSKDFEITVEEGGSGSVEAEVPAIHKAIADASVDVSVRASSKRSLLFESPTPLAFAFTAVRVEFDRDGRIESLHPKFGAVLSADGHSTPADASDHVLLTPEPAMLDLSFDDGAA